MNLKQLYLTKNACYITGKRITPKGIMVHSTGANNPNLKRYVGPDDGLLGVNQYNNHWNTYHPSDREVCVHAFIGKLKDGSIATYQTLPWDMRGWHAGGTANNTHIGFEICEDGLTDASYFNSVYKEAVELCAYLCREFNLTEKDIICHKEGHAQGIASNHGDVMHWFPKHGKSMDTFRSDVKALLNRTQPSQSYSVQVGPFSQKSEAEKVVTELKAKGYTGKIITSSDKPAQSSSTPTVKPSELKKGDTVKMAANAPVYGTSKKFSQWVYKVKLYVRSIEGSRVVVSTQKEGAITGAVDKKYLTKQ